MAHSRDRARRSSRRARTRTRRSGRCPHLGFRASIEKVLFHRHRPSSSRARHSSSNEDTVDRPRVRAPRARSFRSRVMRDDESSGSDYASESEEEIDEREFTCENVRVRARARGKGVKSSAESARGDVSFESSRRGGSRDAGGCTREGMRDSRRVPGTRTRARARINERATGRRGRGMGMKGRAMTDGRHVFSIRTAGCGDQV